VVALGCTLGATREDNTMIHKLVRRVQEDAGAATAEYAIVTMAAVAFAGLLVAIFRSDEVRGILLDLVHRALSFSG
jgi:uncharacterized protein DUF4244